MSVSAPKVQVSHVCLVWLNREQLVKRSTASDEQLKQSRGVRPCISEEAEVTDDIIVRPDISDTNRTKIKNAAIFWYNGCHSVSVWILDPTPNDTEWMETIAEPGDIYTRHLNEALVAYGYKDDYDTIDQHGREGSDADYIYFKIDLAKMLVPLFILDKGLDGVQFEHCIVSDLDVGTWNEGQAADTFACDFEAIYDQYTLKILNNLGVVFAKAPTVGDKEDTVRFENSFAIFKNEKYVRDSLFMFLRAVMNDICVDQYTPQAVWSRIPILFRLLREVKVEEKTFPRVGFWSRVSEYVRSQQQETCKLTFNSFLAHSIDFSKAHTVDVPVKVVPIPVSRFAVKGAGRGGGGVERRYDGLTAAGLAVFTFALAFARR